jgi:hypothetical protein
MQQSNPGGDQAPETHRSRLSDRSKLIRKIALNPGVSLIAEGSKPRLRDHEIAVSLPQVYQGRIE